MIRFFVAVIISLLPMVAIAKSILVFGDSISAGYKIDVTQGWVMLLQEKLREQGHIVHNESISGETTLGGLSRIDNALALHKPDIVVIELGINDGLRGLPAALMKNNLAGIVQRCQRVDAKVLLLGMKLPDNQKLRHMNIFYTIYPELATELAVSYLPFMLDEAFLGKDTMQPDRLHPNAYGQPVMVEKIWLSLQWLLK